MRKMGIICDALTIFFFNNLCADVYTTVWSVEVLVSKG